MSSCHFEKIAFSGTKFGIQTSRGKLGILVPILLEWYTMTYKGAKGVKVGRNNTDRSPLVAVSTTVLNSHTVCVRHTSYTSGRECTHP